jgi:voltage-gated potassium channel
MVDSVNHINRDYGEMLFYAEWFFTLLFSVEYILRIYSIGHPTKYIFSFYGIVDFISILPTYLSLIFVGSHYLITFRLLRMLRIFRVLKFAQYLGEANNLAHALRASKRKIFVFLFTVLIIVVIVGSLMYVIEGEENGFTSIPRSIYWAIVTLTTVGYGDISPQTPLGQILASLIMIVGYGIIAVPTGIVTAEYSKISFTKVSTQACPNCSAEGHDPDAEYCKYCGAKL